MYHLLVVDDERTIVDGLCELFSDIGESELNVLKAYSGPEALSIAKRQPIDVCFTDIRMPQIDGLELQRRLTGLWPRCRVIFLSGYRDFDYVQTAIRQAGFDYVLKMDGDERIIDVLRKAMASLRQDLSNDQLIRDAKDTMRHALPVLQADYVASLLEEREAVDAETRAVFEELRLPMRASENVLLFLVQLDDMTEAAKFGQVNLLLYSVQHVVFDHLQPLVVYPLTVGRRLLVVLIQPVLEPGRRATDADWGDATRFCLGTVERIQRTCKEVLRSRVSIVSSTVPVGWADVGGAYRSLRHKLGYGLGTGREMLLTDRFHGGGATDSDSRPDGVADFSGMERSLQSAIERRDFDTYIAVLGRIFSLLGSAERSTRFECIFEISAMLLSMANKHPVDDDSLRVLGVTRSEGLDVSATLDELRDYLTGWSRELFASIESSGTSQTQLLIARIDDYIHAHLGEELSLTRLSETFHLNPSYLSRLYKQSTGTGLVEGVSALRLDRAWEMLRTTDLRIGEISKKVGYDSPAYFGRCFKQRFQLTPQQVRETADAAR